MHEFGLHFKMIKGPSRREVFLLFTKYSGAHSSTPNRLHSRYYFHCLKEKTKQTQSIKKKKTCLVLCKEKTETQL